MYNVKIVYSGLADPNVVRKVAPIGARYEMNNSYNDTPAYKGTVYDTNVKGWGSVELVEPYASTSFPFPIPLAQFKLTDVIGEDGQPTGEKQVEFQVETYMEAFYYIDAGKSLAEQGFTVEVTEV